MYLDIAAKVRIEMDYSYLIVPFLSWFVAGVFKFIINTFISRRLAFDLVGYGGMPSNHSAIISSIAALIAFKEGFDSPLFGLAIANAFIIMLDANSLRRQVGKQAKAINILLIEDAHFEKLRERMGHSISEIIGGIIVGTLVATLVWLLTI
jgi:uncharacterized protein